MACKCQSYHFVVCPVCHQYAPPPGWISVKDRLPPANSHLILYGKPMCDTHSPDPAVLEGRYWSRNLDDSEMHFEFGEYDCWIEVSHWMPLPTPPAEEK